MNPFQSLHPREVGLHQTGEGENKYGEFGLADEPSARISVGVGVEDGRGKKWETGEKRGQERSLLCCSPYSPPWCA